MIRKPQLSDLQLAILRVLWERDEASASEVQGALRGPRQRALTTISTMLARLERRCLVRHRVQGRQFLYAACVRAGDVLHADVEDLTRRWFAGDPAALVSHLLDGRAISAGDLQRVRTLISKKMSKGGKGRAPD